MHAAWQQVHAKLQLAIDHYQKEFAAAIARLRTLSDRTTDSDTRARYVEMVSAETLKQSRRNVEYAKQSQIDEPDQSGRFCGMAGETGREGSGSKVRIMMVWSLMRRLRSMGILMSRMRRMWRMGLRLGRGRVDGSE